MARPILDPDEFAAAFARHGRALWVLAAAWVGRDEALDLVQETARVAWERRDRFEVGSDLRRWLARIARHLGANWRRRRRPVAADPEALVDLADRPAVPAPVAASTPEFEPDDLGLSDEMAAGLAGLSVTARACLLLHVVMELSFAEVSSMLDIPENTAASHARRARIALRAALRAALPVGESR